MKKSYLLLITLFFSVVAFSQSMSLEDITSGKFRAKGVRRVESSADGEYYYQPNSKHSQIIKYAYATGKEIEVLFDLTTIPNSPISSFDGFLVAPNEQKVLLYHGAEQIYRRSFKANYYYVDISKNELYKLTTNISKQVSPVLSKDGNMVAYVCENNVWLTNLETHTEQQITIDGKLGQTINASTDWVYEEEFGITTLMDFSPDGKWLSYVKFDESEVSEFSFQNYSKQLYPDLVSFKYPKAGEENSKVSCHLFNIESGKTEKINLEKENNQIEYIPKLEFTPSSELALFTLNRDQNDFYLYFISPTSKQIKSVLHETNSRYINSEYFSSVQFMKDKFIFLSERDGYNHIYLYGMDGKLLKQLTNGSYDVTNILAFDSAEGVIFYQAAKESPLRREIYKSDMNGHQTKLSSRVGYNSAHFSANGKYFINYWSNASTPTYITLNDTSGKELRVLEDNSALMRRLEAIHTIRKEFINVPIMDNIGLNAYIMKPINFDPRKKYPLLMIQYSGPDSQQVLDRFGIDWIDYLVEQGYLVACVDGRGTGARGEDFRKCTYLNLGIKESDDQIASARYFASLPYVDPASISIWGWSYGGYNVLMSLSRSRGVFKSGIAIAPVTDWRFYDSVYTERFMQTPQQNEKGYKAGSPLNRAKDLEGRLLLIHGTADDNVHFQNTVEYTRALIDEEKQFDLFMFPDLNHSILGKSNRSYLYRKIIDFLQSDTNYQK